MLNLGHVKYTGKFLCSLHWTWGFAASLETNDTHSHSKELSFYLTCYAMGVKEYDPGKGIYREAFDVLGFTCSRLHLKNGRTKSVPEELDQTVILYINKEELGSSTPCVYTLERKHMKANAKKSRNLFPDKDI